MAIRDCNYHFNYFHKFPVWLFCFVSGSFQVYTKVMYHSPTIFSFVFMNCFFLCESSLLCPKHSVMPCWIVVQYTCIVRVLHFSASSFLLTRAHSWRVIVVFCVCVYVCVLWGSMQPSVESKTLATNTVV